ncbi:DEAD/DEAH box helicase family protein [Candidatus Mesenet endosymbiont of Agriotes lineatus]|uniref:DEAD/DEAH box helicase family protein n=1 Tax=Candidatus Mesenet endosymbiont of Agriotes lineatus TaxID=3077948 RepID=UPI0030D58E9E
MGMVHTNAKSVESARLVKFVVENLNKARSDKENIINRIVEKIKGNETGFEGELTDEVKVKITKHDENTHDIEFIDISKDELALFKELHLQVYKKNEKYEFGVKFNENGQEFVLGGTNEKLPYRSQVSALAGGFAKHLALIASSTGSGKTITKLMFALVARLSGMEVISIDARQDLVDQEYKDQKGAVSFSELGSINYNGTYNQKKKHNILSLENFFNYSNQVIDLEVLSNLVTENNAKQQEFKVDLKNKRITIGKDIKIYQNYYEIKNKRYEKSIFERKDVLLIFDEIQDMVNKGEAYHIQIQLLLLLASWKKINLVITTATPPVWIKEFVEKENGYIEAQSLQEKIASGIGGKIDIEVCKNTRTAEFVQHYVDYGNSKILTRLQDEDYYYNPQKDNSTTDIKEKIRKYITWNLQSQYNRMTLACIDSNDFKDSFEDKIKSPEEQLKTLQDKEKIKKQDKYYNKCDFYHQINSYKSHGEVRELLIEQFGCTDDINEVLSEFDYKSSIAESGVFAVEHGFINNVISCITAVPLDELDKERFSGSLEGKFKDFTNNYADNKIDEEIDKRISDYVSKLDIKDQDVVADIQKGMKIVWSLFKKYHDKENNEKFGTLLNNHNLSREIHSMMPPDFSKLSDDNIIEIFAQGKSYGVFQYLKSNYGGDLLDTEKECKELYEKLEEGIKEAEEYKRDKLDPSREKCELIRSQLYNDDGTPRKSAEKLSSQKRESLREKHTKLCSECRECKKEHKNLTEKPKQALIKKFKIIQEAFQAEKRYPLNELRAICNKFSIIDENTVDRCLGDDLSRVSLVGFYFNDHRKSGFNNTILYNVVMKEATVDSLANKKQCVGRPGRKNGPIISSSYVDSSKISNLSEIKDKLMYGSPFDSFEKTEHKIDIKEHAERVIRTIEEIIDSQFTADTTLNEDRYNKVIEDVIQYVLNVHREMYNHSEYNKDKTYKNFTKVLKSATSILEKELKNKEIVTGGCEIKLKIKDLESKIANLLEEDEKLGHSIEYTKEKKGKINDKLKIEVNFLKALIIKLCVLVLRLWYLRLNPEESQVQEILKKDGMPTLKEGLILKRARVKVIDEEKALLKEHNKKKAKIENFNSEKIKLQDQYYSTPKYIGMIKRKENVKQKDITDEDKNKIIKEQLNKIELELSKV